ncbi:LolA family protein [Chthonomonas calidirosea]|uniref:LolA family protein n=1 Tax=Chthonomonas calidirosea TaxID=454171 RepID=UPI0006EC89D8|nr:DUF2092 domain-containing protein [Chthonomonas calidirosea]CEK12524.1 hypothetical protein CP488_00070 [Chthonomonas calidirosea]
MKVARLFGWFGVVLGCLGMSAAAQEPNNTSANPYSGLRPEVATLLQQATAAYQHMNSYRHTAELIQRDAQGQIVLDRAYTLAMVRPNKYCYRSESNSTNTVVSDGQYIVNYDGSDKTYTRLRAPASLTQIDFVNDVNFDGVASYLISLMLQGNPLVDPELRAGFQAASAPTTVTDNGKTYQVLSINLSDQDVPVSLYFDPTTHLLHKSVQKGADKSELAEIIENVKIDQPVPADLFQFAIPAGAHWITLVPQRNSHLLVALSEKEKRSTLQQQILRSF